MPEKIPIRTEYIRLDGLLKFAGVYETGGQAKDAVLAGEVSVNGGVCRERGKKIRPGDTVTARGRSLLVEPWS